jgi:hypothetical protein
MRRPQVFSIAVLSRRLTPLIPSQTLSPPKPGDLTVAVVPAEPPIGYTALLIPHVGCAVGAALLGPPTAVPVAIAARRSVLVPLTATLAPGASVCVVESYAAAGPVAGPVAVETTSASATSASATAAAAPLLPPVPAYVSLSHYAFNDCDWAYSVVGGVEQLDLSSQNSQTDPFVDLTVRAPYNVRTGSVWLRARFLGAPTSSSTQNVVAATTNPTGTVTDR